MKISTNQLRVGSKLLLDGAPCSVLNHEFHKPGKGQAVVRVKYRNLLTGNVNEKTFKSGENIELAEVITKILNYLYNDGNSWFFMDNDSFEQIEIPRNILGENTSWLIGEETCEIILWNDAAISVTVPKYVHLKVTSSEPGIKGDTVSGAQKPATLETGITIQVPLFIEEGEIVKVDTEKRIYAGRQ